MTSKLKTSTSVDFTIGGLVLSLEKEEGEALAVPYGEAWIRVWCSEGTPEIMSTSGQPVVRVSNSVPLAMQETVFFTGTDTTRLKYPNLSQVRLTWVGTYLNKALRPTQLSVCINTSTGEITADRPVYGAVSVKYTATYERWSCRFTKDPEATTGNSKVSPPIPPSASEYLGLMIIAKKEEEVATLSLEPPPRPGDKGFNGGESSPNNGGAACQIIIEPTDAYIGGVSQVGVFCQCEVYVYFGALPSKTPVVSEGTIETPPGTGPFEFVDIKNEQISWANQSRTSVHYLPASESGFSVTRLSSEFACRYQTMVTETFRSDEGAMIAPKVFTSKNIYHAGDPVRSNLGDVVVTEFGFAVDVTGSATADYTTNRHKYLVRWYFRDGAFHPLTISVTVDQYSGSLVLNPPNLRGRK